MTAPLASYPLRVQPVRAWRGDPLTIVLALTAAGAPVNPSAFGSSWAAWLKLSMDAQTYTAFTIATSSTAVTLSLTGAQTLALQRGDYGYDVQASGGTVSPFTVWVGAVTVDGDYTDA